MRNIVFSLAAGMGLAASALSLESVSGDAMRLRIGSEEIVTVRTNATVRFTGSGTVQVLLVGGGGGGGYIAGGGGGGGGVVARDSVAVTAGTDYAITVGMGGAAAYYKSGDVYAKNGGDTTAFGFTAHGGGAGGTKADGSDGASGGGGGAWADTFSPTAGEKAGGQAIYGSEGFDGGSCTNIGRYGAYAGGGGGAGGPAIKWIYPSNLDGDTSFGIAGQGGDGVLSSISGTAMYYGGGGGGGASQEHQFAHGGLGGGGRGGAYGLYNRVWAGTDADAIGLPGTDGLGGGGGGGAALNALPGGKGGDGVVIFRYAVEASADTTQTITVVDGYAFAKVNQYDTLVTVYSNSTLHVANRGVFDILLVGGGGSGATGGGGGGGGGGVVYRQKVSVEPGDYEVVVGAGGVSKFGSNTSNYDSTGDGGDSSAFGLVAHGGGGGGKCYYGANGASGGGGGSAGGGNYRKMRDGTSQTVYEGGAAIYGDQGFGGGSCLNEGYWYDYGGGGGGAGGTGENAVRRYASSTDDGKAGDGGVGAICTITGEPIYYGGGGGGGAARCVRAATGGLGGGGCGGQYNSTTNEVGQDFFGGGGGAGAALSGLAGKRGGCGVVMLRYRNPVPSNHATLSPGDATGGEYVRRLGYGFHTFTANGIFTVKKNAVVDILLLGGGGGGGMWGGGGGGGGGLRVQETVPLKAGSYVVTIGAGGAAGQNGENSEFIGFVGYGGGAGGTRATGQSGGTGGGAGAWGEAFTPYEGMLPGGVSGFPSQGFDGGACTNTGRWYSYGGGGGGAGAVGGVPDRSSGEGLAGAGGAGRVSDFTFENITLGGGGGGGCSRCEVLSSGGAGGGGAGGAYQTEKGGVLSGDTGIGMPGTDGLGGGGGGAPMLSRGTLAGRGGSGRVVIRYKFQSKGLQILFQ